jgi:acetyltransferase-like isoleucine patch superfamily enzyme
MIGPHCYLTDPNHGTEPGVSVKRLPMHLAPVVLKEGVWLGAGVIVLPGAYRQGRRSAPGAL